MSNVDIHDLPWEAEVECGEVCFANCTITMAQGPGKEVTFPICDRHKGHSGPHRSGTPTHVRWEWGWAVGGGR